MTGFVVKLHSYSRHVIVLKKKKDFIENYKVPFLKIGIPSTLFFFFFSFFGGRVELEYLHTRIGIMWSYNICFL